MPTEYDPYGTQRPPSLGRRLLIALLLLLFVAVLGGTAWLMMRDGARQPVAEDGGGNGAVQGPEPAAPAVPLPALPATAVTPTGATPEAIEGRMLDLEQRVMRVSVAAQAASGYANRAEAIMVAFAARRALDAGAPLGYLEGQIRLRFSEAQPRAVATIINAAADPVTISKLRAGLEDIHLLFDQGDPRESWWDAARRVVGGLVVVRRAGTPSPEPGQRLVRARRAVEAGRVEDAINEVAALPSHPTVAQWLEQARRYNEAHRALDVIEAAAILEPRAAPVVLPALPTPARSETPTP